MSGYFWEQTLHVPDSVREPSSKGANLQIVRKMGMVLTYSYMRLSHLFIVTFVQQHISGIAV